MLPILTWLTRVKFYCGIKIAVVEVISHDSEQNLALI